MKIRPHCFNTDVENNSLPGLLGEIPFLCIQFCESAVPVQRGLCEKMCPFVILFYVMISSACKCCPRHKMKRSALAETSSTQNHNQVNDVILVRLQATLACSLTYSSAVFHSKSPLHESCDISEIVLLSWAGELYEGLPVQHLTASSGSDKPGWTLLRDGTSSERNFQSKWDYRDYRMTADQHRAAHALRERCKVDAGAETSPRRRENDGNEEHQQSLSEGPSILVVPTGQSGDVAGSDDKCIWAGSVMRAGSGH